MYWDFSIPNRIARITMPTEALVLINKWNGITNCYISVNPYDVISVDEHNNEIRKTFITRAFFDFDGDLDSVRKLVTYLLAKDIKFELNHSGNGHHVYVFVEGEGNGQNLRILQLALLNDCKSTCDMHVVGDTQRVSRIPNTWNFKSQSYCIPIQVEEMGHEDGSVQRLGQRFIYGTKTLKLSDYTEDKFEYIKSEVFADMHINTNIVLLPCIRNIIKKINPNQTERYVLVVFLSYAIRNGKDLRGFDRGSITEEIMRFLKENASHWLDWNESITRYQVNNIIPKTNIVCQCRFLKSKGICINCYPGGLR